MNKVRKNGWCKRKVEENKTELKKAVLFFVCSIILLNLEHVHESLNNDL